MKNLKDTLTTIAGSVGFVCGIILGLPTQGVVLPSIVTTVCIVVAALCAGVIGVMSGKNANGSTKVIDPKTGQAIIPAAESAKDVPTK